MRAGILRRWLLIVPAMFLLASLGKPLPSVEAQTPPGLTLLTSRAAAGTDFVDWGPLGAPSTAVPHPFTIMSNGGRSVGVSKALSSSFQRVNQGVNWTGNFAPGDALLRTGDNADVPNPIVLDFGSTPISVGGAQIQADFIGPFTAKVEAFDAGGASLGSVTQAGNSTNAGDNSAIFVGVQSTMPVRRLAISVDNTSDRKADFAINRVTFSTALANHPPTANAGGPYQVNEGASVTLMGSGSDADTADMLTYAWDLDNDGMSFEISGQNPSFSALNIDGPATRTVRLRVCDNKGACAPDTTATVNIVNVAPTITSLLGTAQVLSGVEATFAGSATDPAPADQASLTWEWKVDNAVVPGQTTATLKYTFPTCGSHTVSAVAKDNDNGNSAPVALAGGLTAYDLQFQQPLDEGRVNTANGGKVIQVKITVGCNGTNLIGLSPQIQLFSGDVTPGMEGTAAEVETYSSSSADTGTTMRAMGDGYHYNLEVPTTPGVRYSIRVRPFGDSTPPGGGNSPAEYVLLEVRAR